VFGYRLLDHSNTLKFDLVSPDVMIYNIVAIYAPDGNNATYWTTLHRKLNEKPNNYQILIGDYNVTLDPILDRYKYQTEYHIRGCQVIQSWLHNEEYIYAFRYLYPERKTYSWRWHRNRSTDKDLKGRIDHCLVTLDIIDKVVNVGYQFNSVSDQSSIIIEIGTEE
jgi:exonuclease III